MNDVDVKGSDAFIRPLLADRFGTAKRHLVALGEFIYYCKEALASASRACFCVSFVPVISLCESYCKLGFVVVVVVESYCKILCNVHFVESLCSICHVLMCHFFQNVSDCGSGIGRVTKNFLLRHFNEVCSFNPEDKCILRNCSILYVYANSIPYHDTSSKRPISILLMYT